MKAMKRTLFLCLILLTTGAAWAETLREATSDVIEKSGNLITSLQKEPQTWGVETALNDLHQLSHSARDLEKALDGSDAQTLKDHQTALSTAGRRVATSAALLPDSAGPQVEAINQQIEAINQRLSQLRLRFGTKASKTPTALGQMPLAESEPGLSYENPAQLLIDVRDLRRWVQNIQVGRFPAFGLLGSLPQNNLDPMQVRRFTEAIFDLERRLTGRYEDIQESLPAWRKVRREYDRLGYLPPGVTQRQLERLMARLDAFYGNLE